MQKRAIDGDSDNPDGVNDSAGAVASTLQGVEPKYPNAFFLPMIFSVIFSVDFW
jgi:hypothetical protein